MFDKKEVLKKCHKRLEEIKSTPQKPITQSDIDNKKKVLELGKQEYDKRRHDNEIDTHARAYEMAGDFLNLERGRLMFYGGFGSGYRLGTGKWRYINGKWEKKE